MDSTKGRSTKKQNEFDSIVDAYSKKYAEYVLGNGLPLRDPETTISFLIETKEGNEFQKAIAAAGINLNESLDKVFERFVNEVNDTRISDMLRETIANDPDAEVYLDGRKLIPPGRTKKGYSVGIIKHDSDDDF